jgi:uncharacterized membrane protein
MNKNRLEAFSDGVLAIIVTIMVLEIKVPHGDTLEAIQPLLPVFLSYILSFVFILIYWNNHHHLFQAVKNINGKVLWANGHLLFWLSLLPFATGWMGESHAARLPVILYGVIVFMAGVAYYILSLTLLKIHDVDSLLARAVGKDFKGVASLILYSIGIGSSFYNTTVSCVFYVIVAIIWLIPDKRIEKHISNK